MKTVYVIAASPMAARKVAALIHKKQIPRLYPTISSVQVAWYIQDRTTVGAYRAYQVEITESEAGLSALVFNCTPEKRRAAVPEPSG